MRLLKHTLDEMPQQDADVLLLLEVKNSQNYLWAVGRWTVNGWFVYGEPADYTVRRWYDLPIEHRLLRKRDTLGYRQ